MGAAFKRKRWREEQRLRVDLNGMMAPLIGESGLGESDLEALLPRLGDVREALERPRRSGGSMVTRLPSTTVDLKRTLALADEVRGQFDDLVVLGTGGSALGTRALTGALAPPGHPGAPPASAMRVHVADSIDPRWFAAMLDRLDPHRTLFNVVSRSGDTAEAMSQFMIVRDRLLRELGAVEYKRHVVVTTDGEQGALRQIVNDEGFRDLAVPARAAGPSSILTPAVLFPAACAGVDVIELLAGAADMDARGGVAEARADPALLLAGALYLAGTRGGRGDVVLWPYGQALATVADWVHRLWAASVGQATERRPGEDAVVVFVRVEEHASALAVPKSYEDIESVAYLGGHDLGALLNLEQQAAEIALGTAGRPSATIVCPRLNPFVVGELINLLESTIAVVRGLRGGSAAPPRSEKARLLTYGLAGRPGHESARAEAQRWLARKEARYVL